MNINKIPVIGWIISVIAAASMAVPFWIVFTASNIGKEYFYFLPEKFQAIPFWDCVGLFICISIIGTLVKQLSPFCISQTNSNSNK